MEARNISIDLIKMVAMLGVIALHTTHDYINNVFGVANVMYETGVISIPLFFMTSGYLLLGREDVSYRYVFRKIYGILRFVFIISVVLWLAYSIKNEFSFDMSKMLYGFFGAFMQRGYLFVFWYFGSMIIIYLFYPLLNRIYRRNEKYLFVGVVLIFLLLCFVSFSINIMATPKNVLDFNLPQTLRLHCWLLYFCLGGVIKWIEYTKMPLVIVLILLVFNVGFQECVNPYIRTSYCEYYYSSFVVISLVVCLFLLLVHTTVSGKFTLVINYLSLLFLPVYTLHMFVLNGTNILVCRLLHIFRLFSLYPISTHWENLYLSL